MTLRHTPLPWHQKADDDGNILITDEQGATLATCWRQPLDPPEWVEGNAKMIVAAASRCSLLEALKDIDKRIEELLDVESACVPSDTAKDLAEIQVIIAQALAEAGVRG